MPHKKNIKKGFEAAQEILNKPKEPERVFSSTLPKEGVAPSEFKPQRRFIATREGQREATPEEFKAFKEEQKILAEGGRKSITPEEIQAEQQLREQQREQQAETTGLISSEPILNEAERLQQSGSIIPATLLNFLEIARGKLTGQQPRRIITSEEFAKTGIGGAIGTAVGTGIKFIGNIPAFGPGLNKALFGDYEKTIGNLQSDADALAGTSRLILMNVRDGGDVDDALATMGQIEAAVRQRYIDAIEINQDNPDSVREGLDLTDDLVNTLTTVQQRRFILERYKLTRNPAEIIASTATFQDETQITQ